jgi:hypothetical protein
MSQDDSTAGALKSFGNQGGKLAVAEPDQQENKSDKQYTCSNVLTSAALAHACGRPEVEAFALSITALHRAFP